MIDDLLTILKLTYPQVEMGKMMSLPAMTLKGKVFCFQLEKNMVFKLGKDYDLKAHGIDTFTYLNPFKNKGPMKAWYIIEASYKNQYIELCKIAYLKMEG